MIIATNVDNVITYSVFYELNYNLWNTRIIYYKLPSYIYVRYIDVDTY